MSGLQDFVWADTATVTFEYDDAGRQVRRIGPFAALGVDGYGPVEAIYDADGRVVEEVSAAGRRRQVVFDAGGRVDRVRAQTDETSWAELVYGYDTAGRVVLESFEGADVGYGYDAASRVVEVVDPVAGTTGYAYDEVGRRVQRTAGEITQHWEYDLVGRLVGTSRNEGAMAAWVSYENPVTGVADSRVWARGDATGRTETLGYNSGGQLVEQAFAGGGTTGFSLSYGHDGAGRVMSVTDSRAPSEPWVQEFDGAGNRAAVHHPGGPTHQWWYGVHGDVTRRTAGNEFFVYDLEGRRAASVANDGWLFLQIGAWRYDPDGMIRNETALESHWDALESPLTYVGRLRSWDLGGRSDGYGQAQSDFDTGELSWLLLSEMDRDAAGRLTRESSGSAWGAVDWVHEFDHDPAGQLIEVRELGEDPQDPAVLLEGYSYDRHGRRTSHTTPDGTDTYQWDGLGRLTSVSGPGGVRSFGYDDAGRRVSETIGDVTIAYEWDAAGRLVGRDASDTNGGLWVEERSYAPTGDLAMVGFEDETGPEWEQVQLWWDDTAGFVPQVGSWAYDSDDGAWAGKIHTGVAGRPLGDTSTGMYLTDHLGSRLDVAAWGDGYTNGGASGYSGFGEVAETTSGQHTFFGYRSELTSRGLVHLRNRDYDPTVGVFLTVDPLDGVDGTPTVANPWHYTDNNPLNRVDPWGLRACDDFFNATVASWGMAVPEWMDFTDCWHVDIHLTMMCERKEGNHLVAAFDGEWVSSVSCMNLEMCAVGNPVSKLACKVQQPLADFFGGLGYCAVPGFEQMSEWLGVRDNYSVSSPAGRTGCLAGVGLDVAAGSSLIGKSIGKKASKVPGSAGAGAACRRFSFAEDTDVVMANGETKAIADVEIGDEVLATDPDTGQTTARQITAVWVSPHDGDLLDITITGPDGTQGVVETTDGHKFWSVTVTDWVEAQHLTAGEQLRQPDGTTASVVTLTPQPGAADMWDLTIAVDHNFYVTYADSADDAVLVHNCIPWSSPAVGRAAKTLDEGATSVSVANRSQAEELFLRRYQGAGYRNTTGMSATEAKDFHGSKRGTYHWDGPDPNHGNLPHLQIHTIEGPVIRIFYPG